MRILHNHTATQLTIDISTNRRTAAFHFVEPTGDVRVMTMPLPALERLHRDISARLAAEPGLFGTMPQA